VWRRTELTPEGEKRAEQLRCAGDEGHGVRQYALLSERWSIRFKELGGTVHSVRARVLQDLEKQCTG
jgi:hypothetical protein